MDGLFDPDTDLCGSCGYDPCTCRREVAARFARTHEPRGLAANLPPPAPRPSAAADLPLSLPGILASLRHVKDNFDRECAALPPGHERAFEITMVWIEVAIELTAAEIERLSASNRIHVEHSHAAD